MSSATTSPSIAAGEQREVPGEPDTGSVTVAGEVAPRVDEHDHADAGRRAAPSPARSRRAGTGTRGTGRSPRPFGSSASRRRRRREPGSRARRTRRGAGRPRPRRSSGPTLVRRQDCSGRNVQHDQQPDHDLALPGVVDDIGPCLAGRRRGFSVDDIIRKRRGHGDEDHRVRAPATVRRGPSTADWLSVRAGVLGPAEAGLDRARSPPA